MRTCTGEPYQIISTLQQYNITTQNGDADFVVNAINDGYKPPANPGPTLTVTDPVSGSAKTFQKGNGPIGFFNCNGLGYVYYTLGSDPPLCPGPPGCGVPRSAATLAGAFNCIPGCMDKCTSGNNRIWECDMQCCGDSASAMDREGYSGSATPCANQNDFNQALRAGIKYNNKQNMKKNRGWMWVLVGLYAVFFVWAILLAIRVPQPQRAVHVTLAIVFGPAYVLAYYLGMMKK